MVPGYCLFTRNLSIFCMKKWADFLISEITYDRNHLISQARRHKDSPNGIDNGKIVDRLTIASDIKNGLSYTTIYSGLSTWKIGSKINSFQVCGQPYLRIDGNKVPLDNLGDLPEVVPELAPEPVVEPTPEPEQATPEQLARLEELEAQIHELESKPEKQLSSPRGSLPKETTVELPQELELAPEPVVEPTPEPEQATPEQLARLEELEAQIHELESKPEKQLSSPRGSLPKETTVELPQELELAPEPVVEPTPEPEQATPEQLARLEELEAQIHELESKPEKQLSSPRGSLPKETTVELPQELELAPEPVVEPTPEPEEQTITKKQEYTSGHEILKILHKHNQKLDEIERILQSL